jgi:hypothetical protein
MEKCGGIKLSEIDLRAEAIWGAGAIARFCRVSVDLIYQWAKLPDCPISQPDGRRYFALRTALLRWLMTTPSRKSQD